MIPVRNNVHAYRWYKKNHTNPVPIGMYRAIVNGFVQFMMKKVFQGYFVQMSGGDSLGSIGVVGTKDKPKLDENGEVKGLAISWGKTYKLWKENPEAYAKKEKVYCFNEHTNGIRYNLVWFIRDMKLPNKIFYSLVFCRKNKRTFWKMTHEQDVEYYVKHKTYQNG